MKRFVSFILIAFLAFAICEVSFALQKLKDLSRNLPEGLKVYKYQSDDRRAVMYVAEMDRRYFPALQFRTCVARGRVLGRTTVRDMVKSATRNGKNVMVAVNASFGVLGGSYEGVIHNLHIQKSVVISPPNRYACFGVTESGDFLMEDVKMEINVRIAGETIQIDGLNEERQGRRSVMLYTPKLGRSTKTDNGWEVIVLAPRPFAFRYKNKLIVREVRNDGNSPIPDDGFVLSANKNSKAAKLFSKLESGDEIELDASFLPERWNNVIQGIGGNSRLVKSGKICTDGHKGPNWRKDDPRTALGFNDKKLYLVVVDGRQSGYSHGMTYRDLAAAMMELGAVEAINLDGGSSSTFIVNDHVVNRPSGGKERHVLNAVFITAEKTDLASAEK